MRLLLDTHIVLAGINKELASRYPRVDHLLQRANVEGFISVASIWEIAIKSRLGKLKMQIPLAEIPDYLTATHFIILPITTSHAIAKADPEPSTRDPFDRLLLSQCQVEGLQLATVDRALIGHRLSLRI